MSNEIQKNVFGEPLEPCSNDPLTGWFRDGCCNTDKNDRGVHTVCAKVTDKFLLWSKNVGNDLITPHPEFGFPAGVFVQLGMLELLKRTQHAQFI